MNDEIKKILAETEEELRFLRWEHTYLTGTDACAILIASAIKLSSEHFAKEKKREENNRMLSRCIEEPDSDDDLLSLIKNNCKVKEK